MIKSISFKNSAGNTLSAFHHVPQKETRRGIIFCHGMESNKEGIKAKFLSEQFEKAGFHFLRFDFRYCGKSDGKFENITLSGEVEDLHSAYQYFLRNNISEISLIGSSLGGTIAMIFASLNPQIKKLVTLASPYLFEKLLTQWFPGDIRKRFKIDGHVILPDKKKLCYTFVEDALSYHFENILPAVLCPVLLIHGSQDNVVAIENTYFADKLIRTQKELVIIEGGDHTLNERTDDFFPALKKFICE